MHSWITHACFAQWQGNYFASREEQKKLTWCSWRRRGYLGMKTMVKLTVRCYSPLQFFLYSSFSLFFFAFCGFLRFLCLYLCSCSPCTVLPLFVHSLPQFVPVFLSWSALLLVQWLLKMKLWSCYWRRSITVSPFVSLFCFFFQFFSRFSSRFSLLLHLSYVLL